MKSVLILCEWYFGVHERKFHEKDEKTQREKRRKRKKKNQESKTLLQISSNEGRECGSCTKHADKRLKYDCGQSD